MKPRQTKVVELNPLPDLRQKYGPPDASGHYEIRPGVLLSVKYGEDGQLSAMAIKPRQLSSNANGRNEAMIPYYPNNTS